MKYTQPSFTLPTVTTKISQEEYEIRVGLRCPKCIGLNPCICRAMEFYHKMGKVLRDMPSPGAKVMTPRQKS